MTESTKNTRQSEPKEEFKKEKEFNPYKVAFDVCTKKYGLYSNEQRMALEDMGYDKKDIDKVFEIVIALQEV